LKNLRSMPDPPYFESPPISRGILLVFISQSRDLNQVARSSGGFGEFLRVQVGPTSRALIGLICFTWDDVMIWHSIHSDEAAR
jgi:hypothetical protein